jgi:hypothetical protein
MAKAEQAVTARWCRIVGPIALLASVALAALPARAESPAPNSYVGGLKLVWGSVALPDFHGGFERPSALADAPALDQPGSALALSLPENPGQQFLFSPRIPQIAPLGTAAGSGQRTYLGFSVDVGDTSGLYGAIEVGGSFLTRRMPSFEDSGSRAMNAPLMLHGGVELGYRPDAQNSFALSVDQAKATEGSDRTSLLGTVRLRYGLKF